MKKISLKSIKRDELLSREELKQIMGGRSGSGQEYECVDKAGNKYECIEYPGGQTCIETGDSQGIEFVGCYYVIN